VYTFWHSAFLLFADAGDAAAPAPGVGGQPGAGGPEALIIQILPFVLIGLLFYYMLIRPQRKEQAKRQEMLSNVKKNDRVVTVGGVYGVVMNVHREADELILKVDESTNTKLRVTLSSIARVLGDEPSQETETK
jgi:preprotein translocase subunit YajC